MKLDSQTYLTVKGLEAKIKELELICLIKGSKCFEFTEMKTLTIKLNEISLPIKRYPNTNTHQLI